MIAVIDYKAGNLTSVLRALVHIGYDAVVTRDPAAIRKADRIIFPGVGAAGSAMESLKALELDIALRDAYTGGKPILGICLGTQIIMTYSEENNTDCLGLIPGRTRAFPVGLSDEAGTALKIPHMGWNRIRHGNRHPVLNGVGLDDEFYFVHGYFPEPQNPDHIIGETDYGITFASVIGFENVVATQFHLEKSGRPGLRMLKNFCEWTVC